VLALTIGCSRPATNSVSAAPPAAARTEQQAVVEAVAADLLGLVALARGEKLDGLAVNRQPGVPERFRVTARLGQRPVERDLELADHVWSARTYGALARDALGDAPIPARGDADTALPARLTDLQVTVLDAESRRVSEALTAHPLDAQRLDEAALVAAALALREGPGCFEDTRFELARVAALRALGSVVDAGPARPAAALADAIVAAIINRQVDALAIVEPLAAAGSDPGVQAWARAIAMRVDGDYRRVTDPRQATRVEKREVVRSMIMTGFNADDAAQRLGLGDDGSLYLDYAEVRAGIMGASVGEGNRFIMPAFQLETMAAQEVMGAKAAAKDLAALLGPHTWLPLVHDGKAEVISRNVWSGCFQRRFLETALAQKNHIKSMLGYDDATVKRYADWEDQVLGTLPLHPFLAVVRFRKSYEGPPGPKDCSQAAAIGAATPEAVPAVPLFMAAGACTGMYHSFFNPGFPTATLLEANTRLSFGLVHRDPPKLEAWAKLAPYDIVVLGELTRARLQHGGSYGDIAPLWAHREAYAIDTYARDLAVTPTEERLRLLKRACDMRADECIAYGNRLLGDGRDDEAAAALERAYASASERVLMANNSVWLVGYHLTHGHAARAREIAEAAAEVYSYGGLAAMAGLLEYMGDAKGAETVWSEISERYEKTKIALFEFYVRQNIRDPRAYVEESAEARALLFPRSGVHRWSAPADASVSPEQGLFITKLGSNLARARLQVGDIVVAMEGYAVESAAQAATLQPLAKRKTVRLMVWRQGRYLPVEIPALPPRYRIYTYWYAIDRSVEVDDWETSHDGKDVAEWVNLLAEGAPGQDGHRAAAVVAQLGFYAVPLLEPLLRDPPDDATFRRVTGALAQMDSWLYFRSTPILLDHLHKGPDLRRLAVLPLLGDVGLYPGVMDALLDTVRSGHTDAVRLAALSALGNIGATVQPRLGELEQLTGSPAFERRLQQVLQRIRLSSSD